MWTLIFWLLVGVGLSVAHHTLLAGLVSSLDPTRVQRYLGVRVLSSFLVRYVSLLIVLTLAIRQSAGAGLVAAVGFGLTRWVWVYMGMSARHQQSRSH